MDSHASKLKIDIKAGGCGEGAKNRFRVQWQEQALKVAELAVGER